MCQARIQLAKAQMEEYKALEDFEQSTTPAHWNIHLALKPKVKIWSTKNKNHQILMKRIEYDLPPKFISKIDFSFRIDESIINPQEAQALYDEMRRLTKSFRNEAMLKYEQAATREKELVKMEIDRMIENVPFSTDLDEISCAAFKQYHKLREKRLNLEAEQSVYFLSIQRAEGEPNDQELVEIIAPAAVPTRQLPEEFSLQQ